MGLWVRVSYTSGNVSEAETNRDDHRLKITAKIKIAHNSSLLNPLGCISIIYVVICSLLVLIIHEFILTLYEHTHISHMHIFE